jgi:selenocysteine lyase/cysteine desulfurase
MGVTRKELLAGGGALALAGCGKKRVVAAAPARGWAGVRAAFALDAGWSHFDAFLFAAHPQPVRDAIEHRWALAEAFDWQHGLGRVNVADRIHGLATRLKDGLATMDHVTLVTPRSPEISSGIVCFDVANLSPDQVVSRLQARRIRASVTPYAEAHVRLGTSLHIDENDVDAALSAVNALRG